MTARVCCSVTAVLLCLFIYFSTTDARGGRKAKPGACPRESFGIRACSVSCNDDHDCPNEKKCCGNGCGRHCMAPHEVKQGRCPKPKKSPVCTEKCSHDGLCPGKKKCCPTTCGHACINPCRVVRRRKLRRG